MRRAFLFSTLAAVAALITACGGGGGGNTNTATNTVSGNAAPDNGSTLAAKTPTPQQITNNAPTLTPVIKAYCDAMNRKDEAALRRIYSSKTIAFFEKEMKEQKVPTLIKLLEDDKVGSTCELTNEQINGDTATALLKTDTYKTPLPIVFEKENGEWKLTNKSPALDSMKQSTASNSKSAK